MAPWRIAARKHHSHRPPLLRRPIYGTRKDVTGGGDVRGWGGGILDSGVLTPDVESPEPDLCPLTHTRSNIHTP